jgi:hypothetical protein
MRFRSLLAATALAAVATLPLAGVASAEPTDRDCRDFASQAAAQSALNSKSGDPERLDANHDGVACDEFFKTQPPGRGGDHRPPPDRGDHDHMPPPGDGDDDELPPPVDEPDQPTVNPVPERQILVKPHGAPDTGDGSAAQDSSAAPAVLLVGGLAAAGGLGAVGTRRLARR